MSDRSVDINSWFATCPKGVESLLATELSALGAQTTRETVAGVHFTGPRAIAYRTCLWSRLANRVLWSLAEIDAANGDVMYQSLRQINWGDLFGSGRTIAIDFTGQNRAVRNTQYGAQRSKDAIVDWFSENTGQRPNVERQNPDVRINVRLVREQAQVSIDFSGGSLHQRGYRLCTGAAPLKENLAAAILLRADWPGVAARGGALIDPMCGSATLLIEGAMMAADIAPGLLRKRFGFEYLDFHDTPQWQAIVSDAQNRADRGKAAQLPEIRGYDADPAVIRRAQENIARIGLEKVVRVTVRQLSELKKPTHKPLPFGLLVTNPPYGERLGERKLLPLLYGELGHILLQEFPGWQAAIFTADLELGRATGLRSHKRYSLYNGSIAASLLLFDLGKNEYRATALGGSAPAREPATETRPLSEGAVMFANRIRKNRKRLASWLKREHVECYRLYDADMPEYAVAVDIYGSHVHVAEYQAPKDIPEEVALGRLADIRAVLPDVLDVPADKIVYKQRSRQRGASQYLKQSNQGELFLVPEGEARLLINLRDYLDTGLFLDHRPLRLRIGSEARGKDFLNLYCYTGAATVHAGLGGALSTTSVDLSNTYLKWLGKNLAQNRLQDSCHNTVKADCMTWLSGDGAGYDLILLDPPSFSNSKSMDASFDVQLDHVELVRLAMARLRSNGVLYFSNNRRGFRFDSALADEYKCEDITARTIDPDFQRNSKIHCCWKICHRSPG